MKEAMSANRYKEKMEFVKSCEQYGFNKDDFDLRFDTFTKDGYRNVRLAGFTRTGKVILKYRLNTKKRSYYADPKDVMYALRVYHRDNGDIRALERDNERINKAGYEQHPVEFMNVYGSPENARLNLFAQHRSSSRYAWNMQ